MPWTQWHSQYHTFLDKFYKQKSLNLLLNNPKLFFVQCGMSFSNLDERHYLHKKFKTLCMHNFLKFLIQTMSNDKCLLADKSLLKCDLMEHKNDNLQIEELNDWTFELILPVLFVCEKTLSKS